MPHNPEVLYTKEINLVSSEGILAGKLVGEYSGTDYTVRITYEKGTLEHTAWNLFEALAHVRSDLEREGLKPAVEGACRDVYPSRMALEMGGGRRAYRWQPSGRPATVDIFDTVPTACYERLASVVEQRDLNNHHRKRSNE
ncbi:hypothetical protein [Streptomyces sp. S584]|uniref:hypothetical protein n=1 Tax=Streptomyces sp. S584 TaxID=3096010 RepID=UPI002AFE08CC|nr:hypothetical protein [Streptomyces sp. S584]